MRFPRTFIITMALSITFMTLGPIAGAVTVPPGGSFFDDDGNIFEADIEAIATVGVTKGCNTERTSFCPTSSVTRGQMAAFLVRALGLTAQDSAINFTDDNDSIFENDIEKLATAGITKGCGGTNTFCPDRAVTRGEMAAFLVRALKLMAQDPAIDFTDDNDSIFENDIEKLATAGITKGCGGTNTFCPDRVVTRAQMAAFLTRGIPYARPIVAPRPATTNGPLLDTFSPFDTKSGWCKGLNGEVCQTTVTLNQGEFHLFEYWFADGWSALPTGIQQAFLSDLVRVEAYLNGARLSVVATTTLDGDTQFKDFTFQFPAWLTGSHTVTVVYYDGTRAYKSTIVVTLNITALSFAPLGVGGEPSSTRPAGRDAFSYKQEAVETRAGPFDQVVPFSSRSAHGSGSFCK